MAHRTLTAVSFAFLFANPLMVAPNAHIRLVSTSPPARISQVKVPILVYHSVRPAFRGETATQKAYDVEPDAFDAQMLFLVQNGYAPVTMDAVADALAKGSPLPEKPVAITFDDGWENQYRYAFPILRKYRLTATFFVITGRIGHTNLMTWDQIREMASAGMTIGSHGVDHLDLKNLGDAKIAWREVAKSRKVLATRLNAPVTAFAYPGGTYTPRDLANVARAGYRTARSVGGSIVVRRTALYHAPGIIVHQDMASFLAALGK
jgi:peptidoglycan/xylan/chitin deacetylase (PgdA/CDA1 family)